MANSKTKQPKPKSGLARCMELASDRKGLIFLSAILSSLAAIASFIPYAEANPDVTKSVIEKLSKNMDIF